MAGWPTDKAVEAAARQVAHREDYGSWRDCVDTATSALDAAGLPDLIGHNEVRAILGTRSPNLGRVVGLPDPVTEVAGRKAWLREDIEEFAVEFKARPHVAARRAK